MKNICIKSPRKALRCCREDQLYSYLIKRFLDLVEVIEVVFHCHTDGVHSMRACKPLPGQQLIQVTLVNKHPSQSQCGGS